MRYTKESLSAFCEKNNIRHWDYIPNKIILKKSGPKPMEINRDTIIIGDCTEECENRFRKSFRELVEKGSCCNDCSKEKANKKRKETKAAESYKPILEQTKIKREETCMEKYGNKHAIASSSVRDKIKETFETTYGVINPSQIQEVQETKKQNKIDNDDLKYSVEFLQNMLEKYGAMLQIDINPLELNRDSDIKFQCKCGEIDTKHYRVIEKNGALCEKCQSIHALQQAIDTNMEKRGVPYASQDPEVKQKVIDTNMKNLGVSFPMQSKTVQETARLNNQKKYCEDHPMHVAEIADRCSKNARSHKDYIMPSGKIIRIQGYENSALDELTKLYMEDDIFTSKKDVPDIRFTDKNGKEHRYYTDIYIKSINKCIEVKSPWSFEQDIDDVFLKQNATKKEGYDCEIWVYNQKRNKVATY